MKKRKCKAMLISVRITKNMHVRLKREWKNLQKTQPDITFGSAVREVVRRGLEK